VSLTIMALYVTFVFDTSYKNCTFTKNIRLV
jgi:hypothetical protein